MFAGYRGKKSDNRKGNPRYEYICDRDMRRIRASLAVNDSTVGWKLLCSEKSNVERRRNYVAELLGSFLLLHFLGEVL